MPDVLADRFLPCGSAWVDLASGAVVQLRIAAAGSRLRQFVWSDRCAALARLRHPLVNPLVDFGTMEGGRVFEAYEVSSPFKASGAAGAGLVRHASRFLEAQGVPLPRALAATVLRPIGRGPSLRGRPIGVVLQPRRAVDLLAEMLREVAPGGVTAVAVRGTRGSGLRTTVVLAARLARLEGYVPVAAHVLGRRPWLAEALAQRHVALLVDETTGRLDASARAALARFITVLGAASARRHVSITFGREPAAPDLHMDSMGVTAMHAMVHTDREYGPSPEELSKEVRAADGSPGTLINLLRGVSAGHQPGRGAIAREATAVYLSAPAATTPRPARPARLGDALTRAPARARRLSGGGRHAAAVRLLARASRVLEGRGDKAGAARCALQQGWTLRARGRGAAALAQFERARTLAAGSSLAHQAATAIGVTWTDDGRLLEAEALLRSAQSAAAVLGDTDGSLAATVALARSILWQGRAVEAAAVLQPVLGADASAEVWALAARIDAAAGELARAASAASRALEQARLGDDPRAVALACRAAIVTRAQFNDSAGAREAAERGLRAAAAAHLPLAALKIRIAWLAAVNRSPGDATALSLRSRLGFMRARPLPALLRQQLETTCATAVESRPGGGISEGGAERTMAHVEEWLGLAQTAPDDAAALQRLAEALCTRLRATAVVVISAHAGATTVARAGKPWGGEPIAAVRALASGSAVFSPAPPTECAAPIKYGAETIGALACRWAAGVPVDPHYAAVACAAAALAAAPGLRGLADIAPPAEPDAIWEDLLGNSPSAAALRSTILSAARAPFPVLIHGESGSGKELVARAIHRLGARRQRRLCTVNCAAISDELLEAELFGHTRGAFTGAVSERAGLFEEADGGTLFLDEVGELSGRAQAKLLRVLQDGEVRRVGENLPRRVDTRVIAATNRRLEQEVEAGRFRADLRFRLDVIRIAVPPLRERATDIPALVAHFWKDVAARVGSRATLAPETVAALTRYEWPGNVRELQNTVASLAVHGPRRGRITPGTLAAPLARSVPAEPASFEAAREAFERRFVQAALAQAGGQRTRAARALGVSRQGLAKMLRRLQIDAPESPSSP